MFCLGTLRNGQPCNFQGRFNGYCGHHRNQQLVLYQSQRQCVHFYCYQPVTEEWYITCDEHRSFEVLRRCYYNYENGNQCTFLTQNIHDLYCNDHQTIYNLQRNNLETLNNMTWGPPASSYKPLPKPKKITITPHLKILCSVCAICMEPFKLEEVYELKCKHHYHFQCLDKWIEEKGSEATCPMDRRKI